MSITSCLVFLLCLSLHACNARHIRVLDNKKLENKFQFSNKNDENMGFDHKVSALSKVQNGVAKRDSIEAETHSNDNTQKPKETRKTNQKTTKEVAKTSGGVQSESLASVSWSVPHKKRSEKNPGFNLDYSPPKTHPPSHN